MSLPLQNYDAKNVGTSSWRPGQTWPEKEPPPPQIQNHFQNNGTRNAASDAGSSKKENVGQKTPGLILVALLFVHCWGFRFNASVTISRTFSDQHVRVIFEVLKGHRSVRRPRLDMKKCCRKYSKIFSSARLSFPSQFATSRLQFADLKQSNEKIYSLVDSLKLCYQLREHLCWNTSLVYC